MASRHPITAVPRDTDRSVREQLDRILASATFKQVDRLKRFLSFIVLESIGGRRTELKEYVIGVHVFDKEPSFDPRTDPIVRVQARRLRAKLVRYYQEDGRSDEVIIDLPKGGYAPVIKPRETAVVAKRSISAALVSQNTVSVLPFVNHGGGVELDAFCLGVREEIIHNLAQFPNLRTLALDDATGKADTAMIVSGSVRASGTRLRIAAQLVDTASRCYLWSESIDADTADLFGAQERVARAIVQRLETEFTDGPRPSGRRPIENLAAHNLYLQGRYHLSQRSEEGLLKALEFFGKALAEDAQYAPAHSGLADAYGLCNHYGVMGPSEVWTKAASSAATAVMLDDESGEAHTSLAHVKSTQDWDWLGSEREFRRAISLNPRNATAHHWYAASCLAPLGRLDEALDEMLVAQSLDPVSAIVASDVAAVHFYRRDFQTALERCDHTIELNPHFAAAYWMLGLVQEQLKDFDESEAAFQRAVHLSPNMPRVHGALGRTFALSGRQAQALEVLAKLEAFAKQRYVSPMEFAWIHFALDQAEQGFRWLAKAAEDRAFELIHLNVDPRFDPLRDDRRFGAIRTRLGLG
ncbi:MAG: tetratricopeptide repeat protein [Acidobacteria bacterium]|nr:tetratricopeptide repeat protein [Acidobacteriota bacterium]